MSKFIIDIEEVQENQGSGCWAIIKFLAAAFFILCIIAAITGHK